MANKAKAKKTIPNLPYTARAFNPAHADLARSGGVPARLANEAYVEALARIIYYWAYAAVDQRGRHGMWEMAKDGPGLMFGILPGSPKNMTGGINDYLPASQRFVVTPNNDTFYGPGFADLADEPAVIQTPTNAPAGHYWTIQIVDAFSNVIHQIGSASRRPGGKFLLVGPEWEGEKPEGFIDILRVPTNYAGVFGRSFAARTPEAKARAIAVLNETGMYPLSQNRSGQRNFDVDSVAKNKIYPPGVTAEMLAADPDMARPEWVVPTRFWEDLKGVLDDNPTVGEGDGSMADQARALVALYGSGPTWKALLDRVALAADTALHESGLYHQVGVECGNGWQRQENGGVWGTDWFGRALAAKVYIYVNDYREAMYMIRGTDSDGNLLHGTRRYTITFPKDGLPPVDRSRGGFWSLTMYDREYFMLPRPPNGRTNVGTVSLDADELKFAGDGSLTIHMDAEPPADAVGRANWLPSPADQFALIVRAYVPTEALLEGSYTLPNVERQ
ncbi:MAG: hypothetical protein A4E57_01413 [Syntrophorhabdaceae bacterium PtaU1.Bin034]|nr:MAG: hypothetical protein A4E57_01413 [Syntrophorhabdaceae bacterium PtaU1.Bin034]